MNTFNKILFLDFDGVINSVRSTVAYKPLIRTGEINLKFEFDPVAVKLIRHLVDECRCKIVISSSWRKIFTLQQIRDKFYEEFGWHDADDIIIDMTPSHSSGIRGIEIDEWICNNTIGLKNVKYAIVDDDTDMLDAQRKRFVQTDPIEGLSYKNYQKLREILI